MTDQARINRARQVVRAGKVVSYPTEENPHYVVAGTGQARYQVTPTSCTCQDHLAGNECKHMLAVRALVRDLPFSRGRVVLHWQSEASTGQRSIGPDRPTTWAKARELVARAKAAGVATKVAVTTATPTIIIQWTDGETVHKRPVRDRREAGRAMQELRASGFRPTAHII
jgi:uncharacterized Zn finger protein